MSRDKIARIRELNDTFRRTFRGGRVTVTAGINALDSDAKAAIYEQVRSFDSFTADNDPHGEHDFGSVTTADGDKVFWKIDYYDARCEYGSEDPSDPGQTTRILTIMFAEEY